MRAEMIFDKLLIPRFSEWHIQVEVHLEAKRILRMCTLGFSIIPDKVSLPGKAPVCDVVLPTR